ncbi:MAG TPA: Fe-S cluster assembly protein SufD [Azonexus sp.]
MKPRQPITANGYFDAFERVAPVLPGHQLAWLHRAREAAVERFACIGFPGRHDEDWKYTSVAAIENSRFNVLPGPCPELLAAQVASHALADAHLLVFINGILEPGLCRLGRLPSGVVLSSLGYMLEEFPARLDESLVIGNATSAFSDLNLAFTADGAYIRLPRGCVLKEPIQLLYVATESNLAIQPRNLVAAGADSAAAIVEHHVTIHDGSYFTNAVTDIKLGPGAAIEHHKLQQENANAFHIATIDVAQGENSRFTSTSLALGARLARVGIGVKLQARGASCSLDGLYLVNGRQHVDHHTRIDHLQPDCTSREYYKGVLNDAARAVFNGRLVVQPDARGSDAFQANHNLLLSDNAEIDTKPQLEIWADDVKCSHGATVSQLDDDQLYYLRSRGIGEISARAMLIRAFAMEIIDRIRLLSLQERLDELLQNKLPRH